MDYQRHERFAAANQELSQFLRRVDGLATGTESITERDLQALSQRISTLAPEVGDASRGAALDGEIQEEIAEYVTNLRALQSALEKVRCVMLARKLQLDGAKRHLNGLQKWVDAYSQTR
jgi:uncharacterized protein YigA (DUF484 family)